MGKTQPMTISEDGVLNTHNRLIGTSQGRVCEMRDEVPENQYFHKPFKFQNLENFEHHE